MTRLAPAELDEHEVVRACKSAAWQLRSRPGRAAEDRAAQDLAAGRLLDAVGTALATDRNSVPDAVQRAALQVAQQIRVSRHHPSDGRDAPGAGRAGHRERRPAGRRQTARGRAVPFAPSIRLGRMG